MRLVTLLSDFGLSDVYVGVMKGAIAQVNPTLKVVDLTHEIPPQNLSAARFALMSAYAYFPRGTVHVAVVDPGVGSHRRGIAVEFAQGFLVGPDNGLFSGVISQSPAIQAVELTNREYWRSLQVSHTFHGRDIFAPVGAHLASGVPIEKLGNPIDPATLVQFSLPECTQTKTEISGCIQYIDHFGNLITNIPGSLLKDHDWVAIVGDSTIPRRQTYSDSETNKSPIALIGSHGWVEIAINCGNAQSQLQLGLGDAVTLKIGRREER